MTDTTRIERQAPTITEIADKGSCSPTSVARRDAIQQSLAEQPRRSLSSSSACAFANDCIGPEAAGIRRRGEKPGDILCLENTRFYEECREKNDPGFQAELAKLGDIWVNTPSSAHCAHVRPRGSATNCRPMRAAP